MINYHKTMTMPSAFTPLVTVLTELEAPPFTHKLSIHVVLCRLCGGVHNEPVPLFILSVSQSNTCHHLFGGCHQWTWAIIYSEGIINEHMPLSTLKVLSEIIPCLLHCYVISLWEKHFFRIFLQKSILTFWLAERVGQPESLSFSTEPPLWCGPVPFAVCGQPSLPWQAKLLT